MVLKVQRVLRRGQKMSEKRKKEDYLKPVPERKGMYRYIPEKESPSLDEVLHRISTPVVIRQDPSKGSKK